MGPLDLVFEPRKVDFSTCYTLNPSKVTAPKLLADIFNILHCLRTTTTTLVIGTSFWSRSHSSTHLDRVATADRHDTDTWTRGQEVHNSEVNGVATSPSLGSEGPVPRQFLSVMKSSFAVKELQTEWSQIVTQSSNTQLREDTAVPPRYWTSPVAPGSGISPIRSHVTTSPCSRKDLAWGRRRVSEIIVRCGVIDVSGMSPIDPAVVGCSSHNFDACPIDDPLPRHFLGENEPLITALAEWSSEWVHTLVIQPHLRGSLRFQYQGRSSRASASVVQRIHRVLNNAENPVRVAIQALWLIGALVGHPAHDNAPSSSVPIFRYLHHNGTFVAEGFMFRTFVTCAMISDKTVNDVTLSTKTWCVDTLDTVYDPRPVFRNRLTCIPQALLNWQDTITYLRSCIKMSSAFNPFSYEGNSPSTILACCLDELINLSYADETYLPRQEILAAKTLQTESTTHSEIFSASEWCPEHDPVINQKPRTIGIAPGADQKPSTLKLGTTKDVLDSIIGSSGVPNLARLTQPAGASFRGSQFVIGARTIRIANSCQRTWVPSHS